MDLNKLLPLFVLGAIAWHGKGAIQKRIGQFSEFQNTLVAETNMATILRQAKFAALTDENFKIDNLREFIRGNLERGLDGSDPSIDPWGRPFHHEIRNGRITLKSAGPDTRWGTSDDIERSETLY